MRYTLRVLAAAILLHMKLQIPIRNGKIQYDLNAPVFPSCACSQGKVGFNRAGLCYCYAAQPKINHNTVWFCYGVSRKGQHRLAVARLVQSSNSKPWLTRPPSLPLSLSLPPSSTTPLSSISPPTPSPPPPLTLPSTSSILPSTVSASSSILRCLDLLTLTSHTFHSCLPSAS